MRMRRNAVTARNGASLAFGLTLSSTPASAKFFKAPGPHRRHRVWGGPGVVFGVIGLVAAAAAASAAAANCVRHQPVHDANGFHLGRQRVNVCE